MGYFPRFQSTQRVRHLWQRLIQISPEVREPQARHRAQFLASLLVIYMVFTTLGLMVAPAVNDQTPGVFFIGLGGMLAASLVLYFLSRTRHYSWAGGLMLIILSVYPFATILGRATADDRIHFVLPWILAAFLLAGALLSFRKTVGVMLIHLAMMLSIPFFMRNISLSNFFSSFGFIWTMAGLILADIRFHERLEVDRRAELVDANQELQREIASREQTENRLRESEAQLQLALEAARLGSWTYDFKHDQTLFSERLRAMYGGRVPSQSVEFMHPDDQVLVRQTLGTLLQSQQAEFSLTYRIFLPDGAMRWIESWGQASYDDGQPLKLTGVARDVTERKQVEDEIRTLNAELEQRVASRTAELEAANKELESFSYSISHDLRVPLRAIDGFSQLLLEDYTRQLDATGQHYLRRVRDNTLRMGQLIDDLLAFSRLGRQPIRKQAVNMTELVREVVDELHYEYEGRMVEWQIADLPPSQADRSLMEQVYVNLLSNALKYSRTRMPAQIEAGWEVQNGQVVYFIRDNGVGFDMQYADKLFGVFQRLHRVEEFEGTGVGLATVQRIIQRHDGRIWVEAEVDQGATFYFTIE